MVSLTKMLMLCSMTEINYLQLADLVRETRQRRKLSQTKFAAKLEVSFQSINRWKNGRPKPLPIAWLHGYVLAAKQIKVLLHQMGDVGEDLLVKYFSE